ncbi:MAG: hypothetical protein ACRELB_20390 [Polyangiaceae bacterium]
MKIHGLLGGLAAGAVMLAAGAAFSGGSTTTKARLMDFDPSNGHLMAYPSGGALTTYLHDGATQHGLANLTKLTPPDPCHGLAAAWNATVRYDDRHGVNSTFIFEALLQVMSDFQCSATVTSVSGSPQPIVIISPTAN